MQPVPSWQSFIILALIIMTARLVARPLWSAYTGRQYSRSVLWPAAFCALAMVVLTTALHTSPLINALDGHIRTAVRNLHDQAFIDVCMFVTAFGNTATLIVVTGICTLGLWASAHRSDALGLLISVLGALTTTYALKYIIGRERPPFEVFASAATPSFPSAHATGAMAVYGFLICTAASRCSGHLRFASLFWGGCGVALLAASRVIIGVHYLSDVIAGLLVGSFWLLIGRAVTRYYRSSVAV